MENNMMNLSINKDMLTPVIEEQVKAMMTTILGGQDQIVDKVIKQILSTKVSSDGRPSSYSDGKTYFEWLLPDIQDGLSLKRELTPKECEYIVDTIFRGDSTNSEFYKYWGHPSDKDKELCKNVTDFINGKDTYDRIHNI